MSKFIKFTRNKLIFLLLCVLTFSFLTNNAHAKYCKWDIELFSLKDFTYNDLDLFRLKYTSNLEENFLSIPCNNTVENQQIKRFINIANMNGITVLPLRPLNETSECDFYANSSKNVTMTLYYGSIEMLSPIDGCYDGIPSYSDALGNVNVLSELMDRSQGNFMFILHLNIKDDEEARGEINNIKKLLKNSNFNNVFDVDVGVPELFATSKYYPYFHEGRYEPLVFASRGSPIYGSSYSNSWDYPILFFKISAINNKIIEKLKDTDNSLGSDVNNLTQFRDNAFEFFQNRKNHHEVEKGIEELENIREKIINFNSKTLNSSEIQQINILISLEEKEVRSPDINQNKFSIYYFEPRISEQTNTMKQIIKEIQDKENKIESQKEQTKSIINEYINDLSILKQIEDTKSQTLLMWISLIVAIFTSIIISLFSDWDSIRKNCRKLTKLLKRKLGQSKKARRKK